MKAKPGLIGNHFPTVFTEHFGIGGTCGRTRIAASSEEKSFPKAGIVCGLRNMKGQKYVIDFRML